MIAKIHDLARRESAADRFSDEPDDPWTAAAGSLNTPRTVHAAYDGGGTVSSSGQVGVALDVPAGMPATIYTSDIPRESRYFPAVQWAGLRGLLSDIVDYQTAVMVPLKRRFGTQYSFAHALHAVEPDVPLTPALRAKWIQRLPCAATVQGATRGAFLTAAHAACKE